MIQLAGQRMVGMHRLRLAPGLHGMLCAEPLVVGRTDYPLPRPARGRGIQARQEHLERVVTLDERMAQISTRPCGIVAVAHLAVAEQQHQVLPVHHTQLNELSCIHPPGQHRQHKH